VQIRWPARMRRHRTIDRGHRQRAHRPARHTHRVHAVPVLFTDNAGTSMSMSL
jgi:hypothetical protein